MCPIVKVGEVTGSPTPSARAAPRISVVLPAPRSPLTSTTSPGPSSAASRSPRASVSAGLRVLAVTRGSAAEEAHLVDLRLPRLDQWLRLAQRLLQQLRNPNEVLAQLLCHPRRAQAGRRMEEGEHVDPATTEEVLLRHAMHFGDARRVAGQQLRREVPERRDHTRLDQLHLFLQVGPARVDLLRLRVAVAGRPALEDVRDEDVLALQADAVQQLAEQPSGPSDEGQSLAVLLSTGSLPDEDQVGVGVARAEHHPGACLE